MLPLQKNVIMNLTHIEHIGIAVKNLQESIKKFENMLGIKCYAIEEVKDQKVKIAFFQIGQNKIELLEGTEPDSTISKFIEKRGEGVHHVALAVNNIEGALQELKEKNIQLIDEKPRLGAEGLHIAFIHPKSAGGVLIELCENKNDK